MLLLGRPWGAAAHAVRLSQERSGDRNSEETWSSPRAHTTTAPASCRAPSQAPCTALLSGGLHSPQLLWQALPRNKETAFLMREVFPPKETGCPKHNAMPQRGSCWVSLPCPHPTIASISSVFPSSWSSLKREEHSQVVWRCCHSYSCTALEITLVVSSSPNSLQQCQWAHHRAAGIASWQEDYTGCRLHTRGASTHPSWMNHCCSSFGYWHLHLWVW